MIEAENTDLRKLVNDLNRFRVTVSRRIAFHARPSGERQVNVSNPVILGETVLNVGDAYSNTTGNFTVPYTVTYFIIATTADGAMSEMVDNIGLCNVHSKTGRKLLRDQHLSGDRPSKCEAACVVAFCHKQWLF